MITIDISLRITILVQGFKSFVSTLELQLNVFYNEHVSLFLFDCPNEDFKSRRFLF